MKKKVSLLVALVLLCTIFTACSAKKPEASAVKQENNSTVASPSPEAVKAAEVVDKQAAAVKNEALELAKYNAYIDLNNFMTGRLHDVLNDYFEEFGDGKAPVIDKYFSATLLSISTYDEQTMQTAFSSTGKEPSFAKLDSAVNQLKPAMNKLTEVLADAHEYYEIKGYVDDQFAESKVLHTEIVEANKAYEIAAEAFYPLLEEMADERTKKNLQQYKDNDQQLQYSVLVFMLDAEELAAEMDEQGISAENILKLDIPKFKAKYDVLTSDLKMLIEHSEKKTRVTLEGFESYSLDRFVDAAKEAKVSASEILERVNKKRAVDEFHLKSSFFRETETGTPENFRKQLSAVIDEYNSMNK